MSSEDNAGRLVDAAEISRILSWSTDSVYRAVREGWLVHYRLGPRLLRFDVAEVREALKVEVRP